MLRKKLGHEFGAKKKLITIIGVYILKVSRIPLYSKENIVSITETMLEEVSAYITRYIPKGTHKRLAEHVVYVIITLTQQHSNDKLRLAYKLRTADLYKVLIKKILKN